MVITNYSRYEHKKFNFQQYTAEAVPKGLNKIGLKGGNNLYNGI